MRALGIVLDSVGCGHAHDAANYGDVGADTLGHLFAREDLELPHMASLGLYEVLRKWSDRIPFTPRMISRASATVMSELSAGKDTTTGHWEIAGAVISEPFATFEKFPDDLVHEIECTSGVRFIGNVVASGTQVIDELGEESMRTGMPILYTSADSVLQIAAHEEAFGLARLHELCRVARQVIDARGLQIGRVIARPFIGDKSGDFQRTSGRKDFSLMPPRLVLNELEEMGVDVIGVGKISDIFCESGITESYPTKSNADGMTRIARLWKEQRTKPHFIFANLVDFDMYFGHRRDAAGYARALREFDDWLGRFLPEVGPNDFLFITADHGNDPYHHGTDHTREMVPLLALNSPKPLVASNSFTLVADLLRTHFQIA